MLTTEDGGEDDHWPQRMKERMLTTKNGREDDHSPQRMEERMLNTMDGGEDAQHRGWRRECSALYGWGECTPHRMEQRMITDHRGWRRGWSPQRMEERMLNTMDGGEDAHHRG